MGQKCFYSYFQVASEMPLDSFLEWFNAFQHTHTLSLSPGCFVYNFLIRLSPKYHLSVVWYTRSRMSRQKGDHPCRSRRPITGGHVISSRHYRLRAVYLSLENPCGRTQRRTSGGSWACELDMSRTVSRSLTHLFCAITLTRSFVLRPSLWIFEQERDCSQSILYQNNKMAVVCKWNKPILWALNFFLL